MNLDSQVQLAKGGHLVSDEQNPVASLTNLSLSQLEALIDERRNKGLNADGGADWKVQITQQARTHFSDEVHRIPSVLRQRGAEYVPLFQDIYWNEKRRIWCAEVRGTARYDVWADALGKTSCTCPYHTENDVCKHVAGFLKRLLQESEPDPAEVLLSVKKAEDVGEPSQAKNVGSPYEVHQWMDGAEHIRGLLYALNLDSPQTDSLSVKADVIYCMEFQVRGGFRLTPHLRQFSKTTPNGQVDRSDLRISLGRRLQSNPPKYVGPLDELLIPRCESSLWNWGRSSFSVAATLRLAANAGRLFDREDGTISFDPDLWSLQASLNIEDEQCQMDRILVSLDHPERKISISNSAKILGSEGDHVVWQGGILFAIDPRVPQALLKFSSTRMRFPKERAASMRSEFRKLSEHGVEVAQELLPEPIQGILVPAFRVIDHGDCVEVQTVAWYEGLGEVQKEQGAILAYTSAEGEVVELKRDVDGERELALKMADFLAVDSVEPSSESSSFFLDNIDRPRWFALDGMSSLCASGWTMVSNTRLDQWKKRKGVFQLAVQKSGQDWFEMGGVVDFGGMQVPISTLVGNAGTVTLEDGSIGEVSSRLLRRLHWMKQLGGAALDGGDGIRLRSLYAPLVQDLLEDGLAEAALSSTWLESLTASLNQQPESISIPQRLNATLRPYQIDGLRWLTGLRSAGLGGILADDMGLGKTVQVIAHLCRIYETIDIARPALVIAPASVVGNWVAEFAKFAPHFDVRVLHGGGRSVLRDVLISGPTIFLTTYGTLPRELTWAAAQEFSLVVLDESQAIRNPKTVNHRSVCELKADQKICLTGTPIENSLSDLWAQFAFLNPGLLGPLDQFLQQFSPSGEDPQDLSRLRRLTSPFWLRRTKSNVALELPSRQDVELGIDLDPRQMTLYRRQLLEYQATLLPTVQREGLDRGGRFQVLTALLRLRQIACAPELAGHKGPASKLDTLVEMLVEDGAEGHRALVFSSFTGLLDLVQIRLKREGIETLRIDGSTPVRERTARIKRFQSGGDERVFLISLKAGGAGVNLTEADTVFLLDPWWNPAAEEQAAARAHRMGQVRPVTVYRMIARGTIEERVLALARTKAALARDLFDAGESGGIALTPELVSELLG